MAGESRGGDWHPFRLAPLGAVRERLQTLGLLDSLKSKFGFGEDWEDDYEDDEDESYEQPTLRTRTRGESGTYDLESPYNSGAASGAVRRRTRTPDLDRAAAVSGVELRSVPESRASVTPMTPQLKIFNARPRTFEEASEFADKVRSGTPVVLDLTLVAPEVQRRLLDFASGLTYGLRGEISRIADGVFMITPRNVELAAQDRPRFGSSSGPRVL